MKRVTLATGLLFGVTSHAAAVDWVARYRGPGGPFGQDISWAIATDVDENVYIAGSSDNAGVEGYVVSSDAVTMKYDIPGEQLWLARFHGDDPRSFDEAVALTLDPSGAVYVAGSSELPGVGKDYLTLKYDTSGQLLWSARYSAHGLGARALARDSAGNVCVTGSSVGVGTDLDIATVKYDADGNLLWVARFDGPAHQNDYAQSIAIDGDDNVYVAGEILETPGFGLNYITLKYDKDGNLEWAARYLRQDGYDIVGSVAVDAAGNAYVTGSSRSDRPPNPRATFDFATIKYDTSGNEQWIRRFGGAGDTGASAVALVLDGAGNAFVTGYELFESMGFGFLTFKYDSDGNEMWVARYRGPGSGDQPYALALDATGRLYVTGSSYGSGERGSYRDYATVGYTAEGQEAWVERYNGSAPGHNVATAITTRGGHVFVTGASAGGRYPGDHVFAPDMATIRYSP